MQDIHWGQVVVEFCGVLLLLYFYANSAVDHFFESRLSTKVLFSVKHLVGEEPRINEKLKIYSFDDSSFATLKAPDLDLKTWVEILEALDRKHPEAIYIDQIFAITPKSSADTSALLTRLEAIKTPIITAAFVAPSKIRSRSPLSLERPEFDLRHLFTNDISMFEKSFPPFTNRFGWIAYGPNQDLSKAFPVQGHVMNADGGYVSAFMQLNPQKVVPHIGLSGMSSLNIRDGQIYWNQQVVPTNDRGEILVNFLPQGTYYKKSRRILGLINAATSGNEVREVKSGDVVLILPSMFTGSVDFTESPVGKLPGGFVIASILNSRLDGHWFSYSGIWPVAMLAILGGLVALLVPPVLVFPVLIATLLANCATTFMLFTFGLSVSSLSASILSVGLVAVVVIVQKFNFFRRLAAAMRYLRDQNKIMFEELHQANEVSRVLVTGNVPEWDGYQIGIFHKPLTLGSGDWFAFEKSRSGKYLHYILCDISGHGVQAAIIVSTCKTVLSMLAKENPECLESTTFIEKYISTLNSTLVGHGSGTHTATIAALTFERDSSKVQLVVCGHPRPIHFRSSHRDSPVYVGTPSSLVGFSEDLVIKPIRFELNEGDGLVVYTDGVEFPRALSKILPFYRRYRYVDPDTACKYMVLDMHDRRKKYASPNPDDVSLVWFRRDKQRADRQAS